MMHRIRWRLVAASVCAVVAVGGSWLFRTKPLAAAEPSAAPAAVADQPVTILDGKETSYRWMSVQRPAVIVAEAGAAERTTLNGKKVDAKAAGQLTPDLPAGWADAAFDDAIWPRATVGQMPTVAFLDGEGETRGVCSMGPTHALLNVGVLAVRGKFTVTDLAAAQLKLSLKYRGGVVVYLNGQEIARGGLPEGAITPGTPGLPYPAEAYLDASGNPLKWDKVAKERDRLNAVRDRVLGPVNLPAKMLRKGVNVLAIEVHRSDYHPGAARDWPVGGQKTSTLWTPCAVTDLRLSAEGGGVEPNAHRPAGVQVWNQDANDRTSSQDYGDPTEKLMPIVLAGARNGVFGGKVVVSSDQAIEGLKATTGELKTPGGNGTIPAAAVEVRYAEPMVQRTPWAEPLSTTAPAKVAPASGGGAVVPVWVWVRVPADAPAGDYAGTLTISTGDKKLVDVPVQLHVADWKLPDPQNLQTFVGMYISPPTLAITYKVEEWSDKHWALVDRSMDLVGQLGSQVVNLTLFDKSLIGNDDGMVTWIKKPGQVSTRPDEMVFDYDYSVVDRYLKLVKKHMGVPKFVVLHVHNPSGWGPSVANLESTVTVLDRKTGAKEHLKVPNFGTEENKKFWTPVLLGLKERLAKEGMEKSLCLGHVCEGLPTPIEAKEFADILGGDVQWFRQGHPQHGALSDPERISGGGHVGFHYFTYLPPLPDPQAGPPTPDKVYWPRVAYFRAITDVAYTLPIFRALAADARFLQMPGFGYLGLDFWPVSGIVKDRFNNTLNVYGRWPMAGAYPGVLSPTHFTWPGPDGAEPLTAYQSVREGLQETEAMIAISAAVDKSADKLGPDLAGRCRQALTDELTYCHDRCGHYWAKPLNHVNHYGWQELSQRVYTLAGEVAAKTGSK